MTSVVAGALLTPDDLRFPRSLLQVRPQPERLFARGNLDLLSRPMVAVVGSRTPSRYGERVAHRAGYALARAGLVVVSGLARGLDARAHRGALDAGGQTVAVVGCGLDVAYPRQNAELRSAIAERGLLLSEYAPDTPPLHYNFPARNRIIAALAHCLLVVEGKVKGGTSNTVEWTLGLGKTVFAVPGRVDEPEAAGPNLLIATGARPFLSPGDVLAEFGMPWQAEADGWFAVDALAARVTRAGAAAAGLEAPDPEAARAELTGAEARLYDLITPEPEHVDRLAARASLEPALVLAALSALEIQGLITQRPGKHFALAS